jgi:predicted transglutaminase-like cysteine proteinase
MHISRIHAATARPIAPVLLAALVTVAGCAVAAFFGATARSDVAPQVSIADQRSIFAGWALQLTRGPDAARRDEAALTNRANVIHVAIPVPRLPIAAQWARIMASDPGGLFASPCRGDAELCATPLRSLFEELRARYDGRTGPSTALIDEINRRVNASVRYRDDLVLYGVEDYWASPEETARRGAGDCEDIAIVKMWMLAAFGVAPSSMRVTVVRDARTNRGHAVLKIAAGDARLVLDNLVDEVKLDSAVPWYRPVYAVSVDGSFMFGTMPAPQLAMISAGEVGARLAQRGALPVR